MDVNKVFELTEQLLSDATETSNVIEIPLHDEEGEVINYLSQWKEYQLPQGHSIVNKTVCGCGYTQFCLTNVDHVILVSPRKTLIENKAEQNKNCYYFQSIELSRIEKRALRKRFPDPKQKEAEERKECYMRQRDGLQNYLFCDVFSGPKKILVTNDSLPKLYKILLDIYSGDLEKINSFKIVVDEFQLIFNDSRFKAETELNLLTYLKNFQNVTYVSATPIIGKYLAEIPELSDLPYYRLEWGIRAIKPKVDLIRSINITQYALEEIKMYKNEDFCHSKVNYYGQEVVSKELVIYVSNISYITGIIKKAKLSPDEVNIIISDTDDNRKKLGQLGKGYKIGNAPLKGEPHKMFTLCTSTAYCGVDFYSTNARTIILSDCNLSSMSVDISLELPQILGRQRMILENPFALDAVFVHTVSIKDFSEEKFFDYIKDKIRRTRNTLNVFDSVDESIKGDLRDERRALIRAQNYSTNYSGIDSISGDIVFNKLVFLSEVRAWELQNRNYENDISVMSSVTDDGMVSIRAIEDDPLQEYKTLSYQLLALSTFDEKMRKCCEYYQSDPNHPIFDYLPREFKYYLDTLGISGISRVSYKKYRIEESLTNVAPLCSSRLNSDESFSNLVISELKSYLHVGEKYTRKMLKELFKEIRDKYMLPFSPKASLITKYAEVEETYIFDKEVNKTSVGYKIISFLK